MNQLDKSPYLRDEQYVNAIKSGGLKSEHAILGLYTQYHKEVSIIIAEMLSLYPGCGTESQDVVHDAFLVMIHKIQSESHRTGSLKAFWTGIARKILLNHAKKNGRIIHVEDPGEFYGIEYINPETLFMITERNQQIEDYLSQFGPRCKKILLLWMAQYSMDEIAEQLHLSGAPMARKIKHSCFKKLKDLVMKGNKLTP